MSESILLGYDEVATLLGIPVNTLKDYRAKGKGPRSAVIGGKVKYRKSDVLTWVDDRFAESAKGAAVNRGFKPLGKRSLVNA